MILGWPRSYTLTKILLSQFGLDHYHIPQYEFRAPCNREASNLNKNTTFAAKIHATSTALPFLLTTAQSSAYRNGIAVHRKQGNIYIVETRESNNRRGL